MSIHKYGLKPDLPDQRDHLYSAPHTIIKDEVDLRPHSLNLYDQKSCGSCTGHGIVEAFEVLRNLNNLPNELFSRLQVYYDEREVEGTVTSDAGASIRDGIKNLITIGVAHENLWPYDVTKVYDKPTPDVYVDAKNNLISSYKRIINVAGVKAALSDNHPVVAGIAVYESFESEDVASTGIIPMPKANESMLGGHCILILGYKDNSFICQNSWGPSWGDKGFFYLPEAYVANTDLTSDLWTFDIRL